MRRGLSDEVDEELAELDHNIKRLRIEYDQYFLGNMKRQPLVLQGKVQKVVTRFSNKMPRNTAQRFRFNQLNSQYQMYRQHWGRIMRQIEEGTYKAQRFQANLREAARNTNESPAAKLPPAATPSGSPIDKLCDALATARKKTGEHAGGIDRTRIAKMVRQQTASIREQHPGAKIRFRVVIEDNRAKLKASVSRS
ncbi:MAG: MXAN_5187 C-terminal domain-containing protein [Myxococcota bacterium]